MNLDDCETRFSFLRHSSFARVTNSLTEDREVEQAQHLYLVFCKLKIAKLV